MWKNDSILNENVWNCQSKILSEIKLKCCLNYFEDAMQNSKNIDMNNILLEIMEKYSKMLSKEIIVNFMKKRFLIRYKILKSMKS